MEPLAATVGRSSFIKPGPMTLDELLMRFGFDARRASTIKSGSLPNAFSNGHLFAECIHFHLPRIIHHSQVVDESARSKKVQNWSILRAAFTKLSMALKDSQIEKLIDREMTKEDIVFFLNQLYDNIQLYVASKAIEDMTLRNSPKKKAAPVKVLELDDSARRQYLDTEFEKIAEKSRREYKAIVQEVDRMENRSTLLDSQLNQFRDENLEELKKSEKRLSKLKFELDLALGDPRNNFLSNIDLSSFMKITREDQKILRELKSSPNKGIPPPPPNNAPNVAYIAPPKDRGLNESTGTGKPKTVFSINKYMTGI